MTKKFKKTPRTRVRFQDDALVIENLLNAVMAMAFHENGDDAMKLVEMAHDRAAKMNRDLDSSNFLEVRT